jgi:hypothetical protein
MRSILRRHEFELKKSSDGEALYRAQLSHGSAAI